MMKYFAAILSMIAVVYCDTTATRTSNYRIPNYSKLIPGFRMCQFQGDRYNIGEIFHPTTIGMNGTEVEEICVTCTCHPTTIVQCEKVECPAVNCDNPVRISGHCCDICLNEEDEPEMIELETEAPSPRDCTLGGIIYEHGSSFHPPSSLHSHTEHIYCTVYTCNDGSLSFTNISASCPKMLSCSESEAFHVPGSCCKVCPEVPLKSGECKDELGKPRQHNETWNFYSSVFQMRLTCLNCSCKGSGSFSCSKNPCPPVPTCPENYKPDPLVICCPECSMNGSPTESTPLNETVVIKSCSFLYKVYLCNSSSMAIEDVRNKSVINYVWLGSGAKQAYLYSTEEFRNLECSHEHNYLGGTIERRVKGLQNKPAKRNKIESCTKKCGGLVARMLRATKTC